MPRATTAMLEPPDFAYPDSSIYDFPATALAASPVATRRALTVSNGRAVWNDNFGADGHNGLIYQVGATAIANSIETGWFINEISFLVNGEERWFEYSYFCNSAIKILGSNRQQVRMLLTDREAANPSECLADRPFEDRLGNTCANYTANLWCNRHGEPSQDYCDTVPQNAPACDANAFYYGGEDANTNFYPPSECCQCGGGERLVPEEFNISVGQMFQ